MSDSHMSVSTVLITPLASTSTVHITLVPRVKIEPPDVPVFMLSDSDNNINPIINLSDTSPNPFARRASIASI